MPVSYRTGPGTCRKGFKRRRIVVQRRSSGRWRGGSSLARACMPPHGYAARAMPKVRILVRVRGFTGSVVPVLTDVMNGIVPQHGGVAMDDPTAFDRDGYISEMIEFGW